MQNSEILELFDRGLTVFEISEIACITKDKVFEILQENNKTLPARDKKYRLTNTTPMTKVQKDFIIGCLMGNGGLLIHDNGCRFTCGHLESEKPILLWKKKILGNYVNVIVKHNKKDASFFRTSISNELNVLRKLMYDNNKKIIPKNIANYISPISLAALASDLAWINKTFNIRFQTTRYSYEEHQTLKSLFKNYGINVKICEGTRGNEKFYFLSLNKRNSLLFYELIKPFYDLPLRELAPSASQRLYA